MRTAVWMVLQQRQLRSLRPLVMGNAVQPDPIRSHVKTSCDPCSLQRLRFCVFLSQVHETRHFVLCELDFLSPEGCEGDVCDFVLGHDA